MVEVNCYHSKPAVVDRVRMAVGLTKSVSCRVYSSVWLLFGPYDPEEDSYTEKGTRIVGPVPDDQAESIAEKLEAAFKSAGYEVTKSVTADD